MEPTEPAGEDVLILSGDLHGTAAPLRSGKKMRKIAARSLATHQPVLRKQDRVLLQFSDICNHFLIGVRSVPDEPGLQSVMNN